MHLNSLKSVGLASFGLVLVAMLLLETALPLFPFHHGNFRARLRHGMGNAGLAISNALLSRLAFAPLWIMACFFAVDREVGLANWLELPPFAHALFVIALLDAWTYWWHRLNHMIPFLWRFHAVHHSPEHMDWVSGFRVHPFDSVLIAPPAFFLIGAGVDGQITGVLAVLQVVLGLFFHANVRNHGVDFVQRVYRDARLMVVAMAVVLGAALFIWGRRLHGAAGGVLALALFTLDPNILAHSRLATVDMAETLFFFLAVAAMVAWFHKRTRLRLSLAGPACGAALATRGE